MAAKKYEIASTISLVDAIFPCIGTYIELRHAAHHQLIAIGVPIIQAFPAIAAVYRQIAFRADAISLWRMRFR